MAKLKIFTYPEKILTQKAKPVIRVEKTLHPFIDDMLETMYDAPGIGLAANQVGVLDRILVVDIDYELQELPQGGEVITNRKPIIVINPQIIESEGKIEFEEGCLSVPGYHADVKRARRIKLKYQNIDGIEKTLDAEDLMAVAIQHEIDHLDGRLFIDRLSLIKREFAQKQVLKNIKEKPEHTSYGHKKTKGF